MSFVAIPMDDYYYDLYKKKPDIENQLMTLEEYYESQNTSFTKISHIPTTLYKAVYNSIKYVLEIYKE